MYKHFITKVILISAFFTAFSLYTHAQTLQIPRPSSLQKVEQQLGTSKITVTYSRPSTKGRTIFGELVPYGKIWRTGADKLTDITVEKEITVAGNTLSPGRYSIITIPDKKMWTVIFNREADLWGAAEHDESKDVFRFQVKPIRLKDKQETMLISFDNVSAFALDFQIRWENTMIQFPITINQDQEIETSIRQAIERGEKPYVEAAIFYLNNGKDLNKALGWMNEAEKEVNDQPYIYYWKAAVEHGLGRRSEALASVTKSLQLAEEAGNQDYIRMSKALIQKLR